MPLLKINHLHCTLYPNFNCNLFCEVVTEVMVSGMVVVAIHKNLFPNFALDYVDSNLVWGVRVQHNIDFMILISLYYKTTQHTVLLLATWINRYQRCYYHRSSLSEWSSRNLLLFLRISEIFFKIYRFLILLLISLTPT